MCLGVDRYTEHAFFVFSKGIVGLRELFPSELVEWHIQRQEYTDAIHICQKEASLDLMIQTADKYGTYLWSKEQYEDAMHVWAEYILPSAPKEYWIHFVLELKSFGMLSLIESYLPFDNRSLLPPVAYFWILDTRLRKKEYKQLYEKICRWPVVYPIQKMIDTILETESSDRYVLLCLHKLYDFKNDNCQAFTYLLRADEQRAIEYFFLHSLWKIPENKHYVQQTLEIDTEKVLSLFCRELNESFSQENLIELIGEKYRKECYSYFI